MALEQHAVPTQVTSYEFRLVGDMTLKQFGWLAGGLVVAFIMYSLPLPSYIRWPLILLFAPSGAVIAFVPIEGRGLDRWIVAFIKAIYSPTEYLWRQEQPVPDFLQKISARPVVAAPAKVTQRDAAQLEEYIHTLPLAHTTNLLDQQETNQLTYFNQLVASSGTGDQPTPPPSLVSEPTSSSSPPVANQPPPAPPQDENPPSETPSEPETSASATMAKIQAAPNSSAPNVDLDNLEKQVAATLQVDQPTSAPPAETSPEPASPSPPSPPPPSPAPSPADQQLNAAMAQPEPVIAPAQPEEPSVPVPATFSHQLPVTPPSQPNVIVGMVTDAQGKIVANAIIEIKDESNKPVRAFKTNKLGQFAIATALNNGTYIIELEKPGLLFDRFQFEASGQLIAPIEIKAKETVPGQ